MPVEDINAERLATDLLNVVESSETTSEFFKNNPSLLAIILVVIILFGIGFALLYFFRVGLKKALQK